MNSFWIFYVFLEIAHFMTPVKCFLSDEILIEDREYIWNASERVNKQVDKWSLVTNNFTDKNECSKVFDTISRMIGNVPTYLTGIVKRHEEISKMFTNNFRFRMESYRKLEHRTLNASEHAMKYNLKVYMANVENMYLYEMQCVIKSLIDLNWVFERKFAKHCEKENAKDITRIKPKEPTNKYENEPALVSLLRKTILPTIRQLVNGLNVSIVTLYDDFEKSYEYQATQVAEYTDNLSADNDLKKNPTRCTVAFQTLTPEAIKRHVSAGKQLLSNCMADYLHELKLSEKKIKELEMNPLSLDRDFDIPVVQHLWQENIYSLQFEVDRETRRKVNDLESKFITCLTRVMDLIRKDPENYTSTDPPKLCT